MRPDHHPHADDRNAHPSPTVLVIGGSGGMSNRYRDIVEEHGCSLRHYENRVPPGARRSAGRVALVIIMVGMVSHSLRDQVKSLSIEGAPVVYLKSASVSALRSAVEQWAA
jgi:UDP-N-acetylglucosamine:LPS N-acetylglucosamine transferase